VAAGETRIIEIADADHNDPALLDGEELIKAVVELAEGPAGALKPGAPASDPGQHGRPPPVTVA
jgi:hypothetical protein